MSAQPSSIPTFWDVPSVPPDAAWREKRRLAAALRKLAALCVTTEAPETTLGYAADAVERIVERIAQHPTLTFQEGIVACKSQDDVARFADRCAMTGLSNPNSPLMQLLMEEEGELAVGLVTFGPPFEGIPGHVHGGIVAAAFDQVFGYLQVKRGMGAVTGELKVRYRLPTPFQRPLRVEARVDRVVGRSSAVRARMLDGETVTAEAEGIFIILEPGKLQKIITGR